MLQKLRQAGLIWASLATLLGLAVLIGLGTWQLERKRWKEDLLAQIAARAHSDPSRLRSPHETYDFIMVPPDYTHVSVTGRFHHDKEQYLFASSPSGPGWHVYAPLEVPPGHIVWVNRGFVPDARKAPETRPEGLVPGEVEVTGLVRSHHGKGLFTPANDVHRNVWYWPDVWAMTATVFPEGPQSAPGGPQRPEGYSSWVIEADARPEPPGGLPRGGVTRLELPNRHLEYALTWYGLALTLIGVYLAFAVSRLWASGRT